MATEDHNEDGAAWRIPISPKATTLLGTSADGSRKLKSPTWLRNNFRSGESVSV